MDSEEVQNQLTKQIAQELLTLLADTKVQVKHATINAILQYTKTEESKLFFKDSCLFKEIIKCVNTPQLTKICLSLLIHFSSTNEFSEQYPPFVQPLLFGLKEWKNKQLQEEMVFLLMLNISKYQSVVEKIIGKQDTKNFFIEVLYGFMENKEKQKRQWVIANIFVNITSIEIGRKHVCLENIYLRFIKFLNAEKQALRLGVLKILRNVAFEWQNQEFITELLKPEHKFIDQIAFHIIVMVIKSTLVNGIEQVVELGSCYRQQVNKIAQKVVSSEQKSLNQVQISIDIILILSNCNFPQRKPEIKKEELKQLVSILKFTKIKEETKDKLEALQTFCFW